MKPKWTIIIQISSESNLVFDGADLYDEICEVGSSATVQFVVLMDGMHLETEGELPEDLAKYAYLKDEKFLSPAAYLVKKGIKYAEAVPAIRFENDNLADKDNLTSILNQIREKFDADNYGYIYSGHAGPGEIDVSDGSFVCKVIQVKKGEYNEDGTVKTEEIKARIVSESIVPRGSNWEVSEVFVADDNKKFPKSALAIYSKKNGDKLKYLPYTGLSEVLANAFQGKDKLSFILLDCCWGMMMENVCTFRKATRYLIASADQMPAQGVGYRQLCKSIVDLPGIKSDELAKLLVAVYYKERYRDYEDPDNPENREYANMGVSLSCADTNYLEKMLPKLTEFIKMVKDHIKSESFDLVLLSAVRSCRDYTYENPMVYKMFNIDMIWFLENIIYQIDFSKNKDKYSGIRDMALTLILDVRLYLITAYLSNNYKNSDPGSKAIGGKGLSITFPKKKQYFDDSLINLSSKLDFYAATNWKEMLEEFYKSVDKRQQTMDNLVKKMYDGDRRIILGNVNSKEMVDLCNFLGDEDDQTAKDVAWYEKAEELTAKCTWNADPTPELPNESRINFNGPSRPISVIDLYDVNL